MEIGEPWSEKQRSLNHFVPRLWADFLRCHSVVETEWCPWWRRIGSGQAQYLVSVQTTGSQVFLKIYTFYLHNVVYSPFKMRDCTRDHSLAPFIRSLFLCPALAASGGRTANTSHCLALPLSFWARTHAHPRTLTQLKSRSVNEEVSTIVGLPAPQALILKDGSLH